jgi:hypothetical protein
VPWVIFGILLLPPRRRRHFFMVAVGFLEGAGGGRPAMRFCTASVDTVRYIFNHCLFPATTVQAQQIREVFIDVSYGTDHTKKIMPHAIFMREGIQGAGPQILLGGGWLPKIT